MATQNPTTPSPSRRAAIAAGLRGAFLLTVAPSVVSTAVSTAAAVTPPVAMPAAAADGPAQALLQHWESAIARYRAAEAASKAAYKRYIEDFFPSALFVREEDDRVLQDLWNAFEYHADGRRCFGPLAIKTLRELMAAGIPNRRDQARKRVLSRRRELIAAGDWWELHEKDASRTTGRDTADTEADDAMVACSEIMHEVRDSRDNSAAALAVRLKIFETNWSWEYPDTPLTDHDRLNDAVFEENVALQAAVRVALNLLALIREAAGTDASRPLADVATAIGARLAAEARS